MYGEGFKPTKLTDLAQAISERSGVPIGSGARSNQKGWTIQHGYAWVSFPIKTSYFISRGEKAEDSYAVSGRKEGDDKGFPELPHTHTINPDDEGWFDKLLDWASDILKTGRTLECGKGIGLSELRKDSPKGFQTCDHPMGWIERLLHPEPENPEFDLDLDPDYQREHVWTDEQASSFIGFTIKTGGLGSPHTPLIFIQRDDTFHDEVIDGKQRLTAVRRWVAGEIPATVEGREIWYQDANEVDRRMLPNIKVAYVQLTRRQRLAFYLALNAGGTVHTIAEITKVRSMLAALPDDPKEEP